MGMYGIDVKTCTLKNGWGAIMRQIKTITADEDLADAYEALVNRAYAARAAYATLPLAA